jgi:spermidine synthase
MKKALWFRADAFLTVKRRETATHDQRLETHPAPIPVSVCMKPGVGRSRFCRSSDAGAEKAGPELRRQTPCLGLNGMVKKRRRESSMTEEKTFPSFGLEDTETDVWFEEKISRPTKSTLRIKIKNMLWSEKSAFQNIAVFETVGLGRMLVLDGIIMLTEFDEFAYHEMIVHVPLMTHPDPRDVLIIGGGDGGTVREVVKHPGVEHVHLCEIDRRVVEVSREFLPGLSEGLDDPRVECFFEDGAALAAERKNSYDVIIVDSSDPIGPAEVLFKEKFYRDMHDALRDGGIVVTQCESFFYHTNFIAGILNFVKSIFPVYGYYSTNVPTYPSGVIGFAFCSKKHHPLRSYDQARAVSLPNLKYYSPEMHRSAFVLPRFATSQMPEGVVNTTER